MPSFHACAHHYLCIYTHESARARDGKVRRRSGSAALVANWSTKAFHYRFKFARVTFLGCSSQCRRNRFAPPPGLCSRGADATGVIFFSRREKDSGKCSSRAVSCFALRLEEFLGIDFLGGCIIGTYSISLRIY